MNVLERATDKLRRTLSDVMPRSTKSDELANALVVDSERERLAIRAKQSDELRGLCDQLMAAVKAHQPVRVANAAEVDRRRAALEVAEAAQADAEQRHRSMVFDFDFRQERVRRALRVSASPAVDGFIQELRERTTSAWGQLDFVTEERLNGREALAWTNRLSVEAHVAAIRGFIQTADGLSLEPLDEEQLSARFDEIRAAFPPIEMRPEKYRLVVA